jgi:hypothetical protein
MRPPTRDEARVSERLRTAHVRRTPAGLAVMLTALAVVGLLFYAFVLEPPPTVTVPDLTTASGRFVFTEEEVRGGVPVSTTSEGSFLLSGDGSALVEATVANDGLRFERAGDHRWAYDAAAREALHVLDPDEGRSRCWATTGGWPPLWRVGGPTPVDFQGDAAIVRSAVEDDDETIGIKAVLYRGREAWRASWRHGAWQKDLIVDRETGLVVWYSLAGIEEGSGGIEYEVEGLRLDEPAPAGAFDTTPPAGVQVETFALGDPEIVGSLDEAAERVGAALPASTLDPDGYELVAVGAGLTGSAPAVWVAPRAGSPRSDGLTLPGRTPNTAVLLYSKGLSSYTIDIVTAGSRTTPGAPSWDDLLGHQTVELTYGLFAGRTAHTWYGGDGPAAAVWDDGYAALVTGGLTRTEAISILEGLELETPGR